MTLAIVALGSIILIHSCQKNSLPPDQPSTFKSTASKVFGKSGGAIAGACSCDPTYINTYCADPCVRAVLMGGQGVATYTMTWTGCSSTDGTATQCQVGQVPYFQSQVQFCYGQPNSASKGDSCVIQMQIDTVPFCVQCDNTHSNFPFCVKLHAKCTSTNNTDWVVTLDDNDPNTPPLVKYNYSIIRDDVTFEICCTKPGIGGIIYTYCCSGTMVKNP